MLYTLKIAVPSFTSRILPHHTRDPINADPVFAIQMYDSHEMQYVRKMANSDFAVPSDVVPRSHAVSINTSSPSVRH